jgi:hypothetical protein
MRVMLGLACVFALVACQQEPVDSGNFAETEAGHQAPAGRVIKYGLYEVIRTGRLVDNPDTSTGKSHSASTIQFIRQTDRIPLKKGNYFGFQSRIEPLPDTHFIKLKKVVTHPEMTLPDGSKKAGYEVNETKKVSVGVAFTTSAYSLDEDYELVEGEWTIQYWFEDRMLVEQRFYTYWPEND